MVTETVVRNLLLVDDDEENLQALRRTFRSAYNLFFTSDPKEALRIIEDNVIHVVVSDQRMPGITGVELLQQSGKLRPGLLKVITSALSDTATLLSAINVAGIHRYVVKPWEPEELRRVVDELVSEKAGTLELEAQRAKTSDVGPFEFEDTTAGARKSPRPKGYKSAGEGATAGDKAGERTVVDELPPMRTRQKLRPELIRAFEQGHAALVLLAFNRTKGDELDRLMAALGPALGENDVVVRASDEKLAIIVGASSAADVRGKVEAMSGKLEAQQGGGRLLDVAKVAIYLPEDSADPDEALMRASTALILARKQQKGSA